MKVIEVNNMDGQGWHEDPMEHDLARQGVRTKGPVITEQEAQQIVANMRGGKSPTQTSQAKAQMEWYEDHWIKGNQIPDSNLEGMDVDELQRVRKKCENYESSAGERQKDFFKGENSRIKTKIKDKLNKKREELGKQVEELGGSSGGGLFG